MKYNTFHYEQKKRYQKKKPYRQENFEYQSEEDQYICPQGKSLAYIFTKKGKTQNGYVYFRRVYECAECENCPVKTDCTSSKYNRRLYIGVELQKMKKTARDLLNSPRGLEMRSKRPIEVEGCFWQAQTKIGDFADFLLRGLDKVKTEWGILAIAHNMAKAAIQ